MARSPAQLSPMAAPEAPQLPTNQIRVRRRRGLVVALIGPDGAGKTTLAKGLTAEPGLRARRIYMGTNVRAKDVLLPGSNWVSRQRAGHRGKAPSRLTALLKTVSFAHRLIEQWYRYAVARMHCLRWGVVVFDRYTFPNSGVDETGSGVGRLRRWLLQLGALEPDLVIVLDARPDVLYARKGEHTPERLGRMRQVCTQLGAELDQAVIIDAGQDIEAVKQAALTLIHGQLQRQETGDTEQLARMTAVNTSAPGVLREENRSAHMARKQIRGSSLLMVGKLVSVGAKLGAQILVVRYLSTSDYGAWAYALAAVALLGGFAHLSLDRTVSRFTSIYHEQGQIERFFGTIVLVIGTVLVTGMVFVAALYLSPDLFARLIGGEAKPLALLFVMIFLVPLEAIDTVLVSIFATFSRPRAIFVRNYVAAPAIQVGIVLLLIALHADVMFLAYGYLAGAVVGVLLSLWLLFRILREQGLLQRLSLRRITVPAREMFVFSFPLMSADWHSAVTQASGAMVLGYFYGAEAVGFLRVVLPVAVLNQLVIRTFHMLYVPNASRLFAKGDVAGVHDLYWRTSLWIAVLTFPIFAVTYATATPLTTMLFGDRYAASGQILAILAVGQYVQAGFGFNGATLMVLGKVKFLVGIHAGATVVNIVLTLLLVRPFGAVGAAIALSATMVIHNLLKQLGLRAAGGKLIDRRYAGAYRVLVAVALGLVFAPVAGISHFVALALAAIAASVIVLHSARRALNILEVFPEVGRVPLLRVLCT